jgi:hypothetical protein
MIREEVVRDSSQPLFLFKWVGIAFLVLLATGLCYLMFNVFQCIDGCGPYHNTASVTDLAGDGDLDAVLNNLRHEADTIIWGANPVAQPGRREAARGA